MKGLNTLKMNQATIRHALQLYIDHIFENEKVKVTDVQEENHLSGTFSVTLQGEDEQGN